MKKLLKILAASLCAGLLFSCSDNLDEEEASGSASRTATSNTVTYTMSSEVANLVFEGYNEGEKGPVIITKGTLTSGYTSKSIYLITLSGTELIKNQSTGYLTDLLSGFNLDNAYLQNVVSIVTENIPAGANLVFAGHSLGGMICQQVIANDTIKANYNVLNTVCFGSPLLAAGSREGSVQRLGDTSDVIPYMSGSLFNNTIWALAGLNRENGGYGTNLLNAHVESYLRADVWGKYDAVGKKNGGAKITLDLSTKTFYQSEAWF